MILLNKKLTKLMYKIIFIAFSFLSLVDANPIRIMPLGDSITEGNFYLSDLDDVNISTYTSGLIPENDQIAYRGNLWTLFVNAGYSFNVDIDFVGTRSKGSNYHADFDTDHQGWSGITSEGIKNGISAWLDAAPADIILFHIGTNDPGQGIPIGSNDDINQSANTSINNIKSTLNTVFLKNPNTKVLLAKIIKNSRAEAWGYSTVDFNTALEVMVNAHPFAQNIIIVDMYGGAGMIYEPSGIDMLPKHLEENNAYDYHPDKDGFLKVAQKWFDALIASDWLPVPLTNTNTTYGTELIQGGNNENGILDVTSWSGVGMSYNNYVGINTYQNINYLNCNPLANNGGIYQAIATQVGKTYLLKATLLGSNHYTDINNYTLASSYISVEDTTPTPTSLVNYVSNFVTGDIPTTVEISFTATSNTTYIALRGDTAFKYPNLSMISVKEILADTTPNATNNIISPTAALGTIRSTMANNGDGTYTISNPEGNISPYAYLRVSQTGYSGDTIRDLVAGENLTVKLRVKSTTPLAYIRSTQLNINATYITTVDTWQNIELNVTVDNAVDNRAFIAFALPHYVTGEALTIDMNSAEILGSL